MSRGNKKKDGRKEEGNFLSRHRRGGRREKNNDIKYRTMSKRATFIVYYVIVMIK
jgi:hypothetical protein